jgi:hypothetical protein
MSKVSTHESESYAAFIARKTKEEDNKSSIISSISTNEALLESNKHIDDMEPAEITIDNKQNTMNIDLNLDAYVKLMPANYSLMPDSTEIKYVEHNHTTYETIDDVLNTTAEGMKFDNGKPDYSLLPFAAVDEVVKVLTYGAAKYDRFNWEKVDAVRYQAATMRHFSTHMQGEKIDPESGISHLAHAICSLLYLLDFELKGK